MEILFLDIETAPEYATFDELPDDGKLAFKKKFQHKVDSGEYPDLATIYEKEAALYAEFAKIVCIGLGSIAFNGKEGVDMAYLKALTGTEDEILQAFILAVEKMNPTHICAHRGKKFDFPFIARRMHIARLPLPSILNITGKPKWEIAWLDTAELWQFGDYSHYVSLITLCFVFKIPSPKQTLEGSEVPAAFYRGEIQLIANYCLDDTFALINVFRAMQNAAPIVHVKRVLA